MSGRFVVDRYLPLMADRIRRGRVGGLPAPRGYAVHQLAHSLALPHLQKRARRKLTIFIEACVGRGVRSDFSQQPRDAQVRQDCADRA